MTPEQIKEHALRLANDYLETMDFSYVYEDEDLEEATEKEQQQIFDMARGTIVVFEGE